MSKIRDFTPFARGTSIGDAWFQALDLTLNADLPAGYLDIQVKTPVLDFEKMPVGTDLDSWDRTVNVGWVYDTYCDFEFDRSDKRGGKDGHGWIESRIYELYEGLYHDRLQDPDQIDMIVNRLQKGTHGSCTNALVAQVYSIGDDLKVATSGRPFAKDMACLTQVQFKPVKDRLHLYATFRSQYLDAKAYGNLISLAMLQAQVCAQTDYNPGYLIERVNNAICYNESTARDLYGELLQIRYEKQVGGFCVTHLVRELELTDEINEAANVVYQSMVLQGIAADHLMLENMGAAVCISCRDIGLDIESDVAELIGRPEERLQETIAETEDRLGIEYHG